MPLAAGSNRILNALDGALYVLQSNFLNSTMGLTSFLRMDGSFIRSFAGWPVDWSRYLKKMFFSDLVLPDLNFLFVHGLGKTDVHHLGFFRRRLCSVARFATLLGDSQ